jgi:hypothetical protein
MILKMDLDWLKVEVEKIPGDSGWWHSSGAEDFVVLGAELIGKGLDRYEALEFLIRAYWATANEFGL